MKSEIVTKVNKIGKAGQIITTIGKVILWIGLVACLVGGIILAVMPDDLVVMHMSGDATVELNFPAGTVPGAYHVGPDGVTGMTWGEVKGDLEVNGQEYGLVGITPTEKGFLVDAEAEGYTLELQDLAMLPFLGAISCAAVLVVMHFVGKLCKLFSECESPFTYEIAHTLKTLAISIIPMVFFSNITEGLTNSIGTGEMNIVIGVDLMTVLLVLLVFMLSIIFNYGTMLQQESDETL